jgi:hypothetical protein
MVLISDFQVLQIIALLVKRHYPSATVDYIIQRPTRWWLPLSDQYVIAKIEGYHHYVRSEARKVDFCYFTVLPRSGAWNT